MRRQAALALAVAAAGWPFEGDRPFSSCTSLRTSPGEVIALALDALFPGGEILDPFGNWIQPPTRYNAMGVIESGPHADLWPEREVVTLSQLEDLASMPATDTPAPSKGSGAADSANSVIVAACIVGFTLAWGWLPRRRRRRALAALVIALGACSPAPSPSGQPTSVPSATLVATPLTTTTPTTEPTASPITFSFDVENCASVGVIVSVASDTAATLPGFEPGQQGTIAIRLLNPENGISVEIQGSECRLLASAMYPTPVPFTLLVEDGPQAGTIQLSTRAGISQTPMPLPSNSLIGCGG